MQTLKLLISIVVASLLMAACAGATGGSGTTALEFKSTGGTYRVQASAGWKLSEPMMGYSSVVTNENDINILVLMTNPDSTTLNSYTNPREMTAANGKKIMVYNQPAGFTMTSTVNGIKFEAADTLSLLVPIGDNSYLVGVSPATTRKLDDALTKQIVDMVGKLDIVADK